ncbi:helix-turn-helix domain-containing protein [Salmonella enterica]|nr:helix-turn-helix domain-containing protein [Salmonella enterica]
MRYARKYSDLKQSHIANALGVTIQAVSLWENDSTVPTCDKIIPLANVLKCDLMWLLTGEATRQSPATPDHQSRHHHSERLRSDALDHASHHEKTPSQAQRNHHSCQ